MYRHNALICKNIVKLKCSKEFNVTELWCGLQWVNSVTIYPTLLQSIECTIFLKIWSLSSHPHRTPHWSPRENECFDSLWFEEPFFFTNAMGLTNFCSTERVFYLFTLFKISQLKSVSFFPRVLSKGEKRRTGDIKKSFVKNSDVRALQKIQWYSFRTADLAFFAARRFPCFKV